MRSDAEQLCVKHRGIDCNILTRVLTLDELSVGLYMAFSRTTDEPVVERLKRAYLALEAEGALTRLE
ncbi:MAG: hypothetical protein R3E45_14365 [Rhodocyclaceae bacterium]